MGICGHIEDIVVAQGYRGKNIGIKLIELLKQLAVVNKCYKVILDCDTKNVAFYEKVSFSISIFDTCIIQCGMHVKGAQMAWYVDEVRAKL